MVRLAKPSERPSGRLREKARSKLRFVLESASTLARGASLGHPRASCAPRGPALDLQDRRAPPGSPTMPQGGSAAQIFDLGQWAAWPRRISGVRNATRRRAAASPRRRRAGRDAASREDNLGSGRRDRDRVAVAASGTQPLPTGESKIARVAAPRRRRALGRGTRYWRLARPATARRACRSGRHPSHDASVGDGCVRC